MQHNCLLILGTKVWIIHYYLIEYNLTFPTGVVRQTIGTTGEIYNGIFFRILRGKGVLLIL